MERRSSSGREFNGVGERASSSCVDSRTRNMRERSEDESWNIFRAEQMVCTMVARAFFMTCVTSRTGKDCGASESGRWPLGMVEVEAFFMYEASGFHARLDCNAFDRCERKAVSVSLSGRESRTCNVTRIAHVS